MLSGLKLNEQNKKTENHKIKIKYKMKIVFDLMLYGIKQDSNKFLSFHDFFFLFAKIKRD